MGHEVNITQDLGPQFTVAAASEQLTLEVGVKSSSLFSLVVNNPSSSDGIEVIAKTTIGAYKAVTQNGYICQPTLADVSNYAGITTVAYVLNDTMTAVRTGRLTEASWLWTPNTPIFIGVDGVLTQTVPSYPIRRIGWAVSATQINLDPYPIITGV